MGIIYLFIVLPITIRLIKILENNSDELLALPIANAILSPSGIFSGVKGSSTGKKNLSVGTGIPETTLELRQRIAQVCIAYFKANNRCIYFF